MAQEGRPTGAAGAHRSQFCRQGAAWAGRHGIDEAAFPQTFKIDYIRVCQFTSSERGGRKCGPSDVTPDPNDFGYTATLNDMPKPTFLNVTKVVADKRPDAGVLSMSTTDPLKIEVPIKIPDDYPTNRTLQVYVFDATTGAMVASSKKPLQQATRKEGEDGVSVLE